MSFELNARDTRIVNGLRDEVFAGAACSGEDTEIFYPEDKTGEYKEWCIERAKEICEKCDVAALCLRLAQMTGEQDGIWGGKTLEERKSINRTNVRRARSRSLDDISA